PNVLKKFLPDRFPALGSVSPNFLAPDLQLSPYDSLKGDPRLCFQLRESMLPVWQDQSRLRFKTKKKHDWMVRLSLVPHEGIFRGKPCWKGTIAIIAPRAD